MSGKYAQAWTSILLGVDHYKTMQCSDLIAHALTAVRPDQISALPLTLVV